MLEKKGKLLEYLPFSSIISCVKCIDRSLKAPIENMQWKVRYVKTNPKNTNKWKSVESKYLKRTDIIIYWAQFLKKKIDLSRPTLGYLSGNTGWGQILDWQLSLEELEGHQLHLDYVFLSIFHRNTLRWKAVALSIKLLMRPDESKTAIFAAKWQILQPLFRFS